jgi:hypothetical protein
VLIFESGVPLRSCTVMVWKGIFEGPLFVDDIYQRIDSGKGRLAAQQ